MRIATLGELCDINPRLAAGRGLTDDTRVSFVPMAAVSELSASIVDRRIRTYAEVKKGCTYFADSDVLLAKITPCMENGKCAIARALAGGRGFGSTEFHVFRSRGDVLPEWMFYFIRRAEFRSEAKRNFTVTGGQLRVPA